MILHANNLQQAMINISRYVTIESACTVMQCWYRRSIVKAIAIKTPAVSSPFRIGFDRQKCQCGIWPSMVRK